MGLKIRTEKELIIKLLLLLLQLLLLLLLLQLLLLLLLLHLLQGANISSEVLAPCYRTVRCYSPEGSVHNCMRIQQDR
jgi:hypothetical protein